MKKLNSYLIELAALAFVTTLLSSPGAWATCSYTTNGATAIGTINYVGVYNTVNNWSPETTTFTISPMPSAVPKAEFQYFSISPNTVTDAQTRKNFVAIIMLAKATGAKIEVAYNSTGCYLDQQMIGVYYIVMVP